MSDWEQKLKFGGVRSTRPRLPRLRVETNFNQRFSTMLIVYLHVCTFYVQHVYRLFSEKLDILGRVI